MGHLEQHRGEFTLSTDKSRLGLAAVHEYLSGTAYWALGRSYAMVEKSIEHSLCFGIYAQDGRQAGFARVVTDYATFAWLCDVFIFEGYRGRGLGKWLVEAVVIHPELQSIQRIVLATRDAHELYRRYGGFERLQAPERWMARAGNR
jgi:GNAT superfamily N-acetyltransferase